MQVGELQREKYRCGKLYHIEYFSQLQDPVRVLRISEGVIASEAEVIVQTNG